MWKTVWILFFVVIFSIVVNLLGLLLGINLTKYEFFRLILLGLPVILLMLHAVYTKGLARGLTLIFLAMIVGWFMETMGLKWGTVFGGLYSYGGNSITVGIVPLPAICYWAVFIYTGYSVVNSFYVWIGKQLPRFHKNTLFPLILTIILDGLMVNFIDLFMDPIQVAQKAWTWRDSGPYFRIPIGNFVGWLSRFL